MLIIESIQQLGYWSIGKSLLQSIRTYLFVDETYFEQSQVRSLQMNTHGTISCSTNISLPIKYILVKTQASNNEVKNIYIYQVLIDILRGSDGLRISSQGETPDILTVASTLAKYTYSRGHSNIYTLVVMLVDNHF